MQIGIKKVSEQDDNERFVLYNRATGEAISKNDNSESTLRNWLSSKDFPSELIDHCFEHARKRFTEENQAASSQPEESADLDDSDEKDLDFFLAELEEEDG